MRKPATQYTKCGHINIAYQVFGNGSMDLVYMPGWVSNIDLMWGCPELVDFSESLGKSFRVIKRFNMKEKYISPMKHLYSLSKNNITHLEADANYTILQFKNGKVQVSSFTLKLHHTYFKNFLRPSRKFLINPAIIKSINSDSQLLKTSTDMDFNISRRRVKEVEKRYSEMKI